MRKLIRSKRTKAFLKPDGAWTHNPREALHLLGPISPAVRESLKHDEVEIYFSFDADHETEWDFALPMV